MFSWWTVISLGIYAAAGGLGILIARRKSLPKIIGGSLACSLLFYVAANTFSWWHDVVVHMTPGYPRDAGGLVAGEHGRPCPAITPTWIFLRNGMAGDLFFVLAAFAGAGSRLSFGPGSRPKLAPRRIGVSVLGSS